MLHQERKDKNSGGHLFRGEDWETSKPGGGRFIDTPSIRILGLKTTNFHTLILNQSRSLKVSLFSVCAQVSHLSLYRIFVRNKQEVLTNPSMKMIGHNTLDAPRASFFVFSALGSTCGKIVGMRETKRPTNTTRAHNSFKRVGFLRKMTNLQHRGGNIITKNRAILSCRGKGQGSGLFPPPQSTAWLAVFFFFF